MIILWASYLIYYYIFIQFIKNKFNIPLLPGYISYTLVQTYI